MSEAATQTPADPAATPAAPVTPAASATSGAPATPAAAATPATSPPATDPAAPATVLTDPATPDPAAIPAADFPADWRSRMAGGDAKVAKRLERFASPDLVTKAWLASEQKITSGEYKIAALGDNATPEEIAAWRAGQGIPEKADGYLETLDKGLVISEQDKPLVGVFLEKMHGKNASPEVVGEALSAYYAIQEKAQAEQYTRDATAKTTTEDTLRGEWGQEYRRNINDISNLLGTAPNGVSEAILNSRLPDGTPAFSNPDVLRFFVSLSREINPAGTVAPSSGSPGADISTELEGIRKMQTTDPQKYWSDAVQKRERDLIAASEKVKARAA